MQREHLRYITSTITVKAWEQNGILLTAEEWKRGNWTIRANTVQVNNVRPSNVFSVMMAMWTTAVEFKPMQRDLNTHEQELLHKAQTNINNFNKRMQYEKRAANSNGESDRA